MDETDTAIDRTSRGNDARGQASACDGFSLVELLVVVIIVGILAAVAIPTLLSQRDAAAEAAVQSDLRNAGTLQVGQMQAGAAMASNYAELLALGFRPSNSVSIIDGNFLLGDTGFCIEGRPANGTGRTWAVSSDDGLSVVVEAGC